MLHKNTMLIAADRACFFGNNRPQGGWRQLGAMSLILGLSGRFHLNTSGDQWHDCRSALLGAGVRHRIDPQGEAVAVMYLEPDTREARAMGALLQQHAGAVLDAAKPPPSLSMVNTYLRGFDLQSLLGFRLPKAAPLDARISACLQQLRMPRLSTMSRRQAASGAGLSESRFNHLFREQMGVHFRSYRTWSQLLEGVKAARPTASLTELAATSGFSDLPHFSRKYHDAFGVAPSQVLGSMAVTVL